MTNEVFVRRREDFESFYRRNFHLVLRMVWGLAGSPGAAEDLTQEAFLAASRRWDEIGDLDDPIGWVRRVALNRASSGFHRRAAEARALLRHGPDRGVVEDPMPSESRHVWAEVARLPKRQRQAIVLCYVESYSRAEVAALMGVAEETVKTHLDRGRRTLAARLGEDR